MTDIIDLAAFTADPHTEGLRVTSVPDFTDWEGISRALQEYPGLVYYAQSRYRRAVSDMLVAERVYKTAYRKALAELRERGAAVSEAKETAELDGKVMAAAQEHLDAEREVGKWRALVDGLTSKGDALQQISSRQKAELSKNWTYNDPKEG